MRYFPFVQNIIIMKGLLGPSMLSFGTQSKITHRTLEDVDNHGKNNKYFLWDENTFLVCFSVEIFVRTPSGISILSNVSLETSSLLSDS